MQIVVPMAGEGTRFVRAGYKTLKPLINVDGLPMIEHVVRMFPGEHDFIFICAHNHLQETPLRTELERLAPNPTIVGIDPHKFGPVYTALAAAEHINDDEPVILNYCDSAVLWDYADFKQTVTREACAGAVVAFKGFHPHSLGDTLYAYIREQDHRLEEIREKHAFTPNRMQEYASTGTYYFASGTLLKDTFRRAVEQNLQVNGEFYASLPYNLLAQNNQPVHVYAVDYFIHWGVPAALEEYRNWSTYFANYANWRPNGPAMAGANLIPMAGAGSRFSRAGYTQPKPLVPVVGAPMIERALHSFPPAQNWLAACRTDHLQHSTLAATLSSNGYRMQILPVDHLTEGQAATCLLARSQLPADQPLLIAPCDAALVYNQTQYAALTADPQVDAVVWTFRNHPHANRNPSQYGWVQTGPTGDIEHVTCKTPISATPRHDPGIIGAFWFRQARFFWEAADKLMAENRRVNDEFYVDSTIEILLEQGRRAKIFDVDHYVCFGTPDDVRSFEFWSRYFHHAPHHLYQNGHHL